MTRAFDGSARPEVDEVVSAAEPVASGSADLPPFEPWIPDPETAAVLEHITDVVAIADEFARVRYCTPSIVEVLGYTPEEMVGSLGFEIVHPDDMTINAEEMAEVLAGSGRFKDMEPTMRVTMRFRHRDGSWRHLDMWVTNRFADPHIGGLMVTFRDSTDRVDALEALRASEERFKAFVQGSHDVLSVHDVKGICTYVSPAITRVLGFQPEEVIGTSNSLVHPDDLAPMKARIADAFAGGDPSVRVEYRVRTKGGSWRHVEALATNLLEDPAVRGIVMNARDATDRRRAQLQQAAQARVLDLVAAGAGLDAVLGALVSMVEDDVGNSRCAIVLHGRDSRGDPVLEIAPHLPSGWRDRPGVKNALSTRAPLGTVLFGDRGPDDPAYVWSCPIVTPGGRALGAVALFPEGLRNPSDEECRAVDLAATVAAIAVERVEAASRLAHQATHDSLTGLPNRAEFVSRLAAALGDCGPDDQVAVLFVDLDHFKDVNDVLGHPVGDQLLVALSRRVERALRADDVLARLGGDEFVILCSRCGCETANHVAGRVLDCLRDPFSIGGEEIAISASIGVALADSATDPDVLVREADVAMYQAKERGRACVQIFDDRMRTDLRDRLQTESSLRHALGRGELELHYQPIVGLDDGAPAAVEALLRWHRPGHGLVLPGAFIGVAERTGLIAPIGQWVIEEAARQAAAWSHVRTTGMPVAVSANLSARQLANPRFAALVESALEGAGADPSLLLLEITEGALVEDIDGAIDAMRDVRDLGVAIALDDFGTGYSSLERLKRLPVDVLKIDRTFVAGLGGGGSEDAIVSGILAMAHALELSVIAEGVEEEAQAERLRELGCSLAQGFLFARPAPAGEVEPMLAAAPPAQQVSA